MSRVDGGAVVELEQTLLDRLQNQLRIAAPEVGPADAAAKQGITGEQKILLGRDTEASAAGRMPRRVNTEAVVPAELQTLAIFEFLINRLGGFEWNPKGAALHGHVVIEPLIARMQQDLCAGRRPHGGGSADVVEVGMGVQQVFDAQAQFLDALEDLGGIATGIDDDRFFGFVTGDDAAITLDSP